MNALRTVPTKNKGFRAWLGPRGKCRSLQGLLESTKKNGGSHAFFGELALNLNKIADISIFLKKKHRKQHKRPGQQKGWKGSIHF